MKIKLKLIINNSNNVQLRDINSNNNVKNVFLLKMIKKIKTKK